MASKVRASSNITHDNIGIGICHLHLFPCLLSYDGLVKQDMIEHTAHRVVGVITSHSLLYCFTNGESEATGTIRPLLQHISSCLGFRAGAGYTLGSPGLHCYSAIWLLVVTDPDHIDLDLYTKKRTGHAQGTSPLPGAGLGSYTFDAFLHVIVALGCSTVGLMASGLICSFIFVKNLCWRV